MSSMVLLNAGDINAHSRSSSIGISVLHRQQCRFFATWVHPCVGFFFSSGRFASMAIEPMTPWQRDFPHIRRQHHRINPACCANTPRALLRQSVSPSTTSA